MDRARHRNNESSCTMAQHTTRGHLGTHAIVELFGCKHLNDLTLVQDALVRGAEICGATILHTKFHKFSPQGITGYILLAESHISIHTWPEHGYAAVDVFTCGAMETERAFNHIAKQLGAERVEKHTFLRGPVDEFTSLAAETPGLALVTS